MLADMLCVSVPTWHGSTIFSIVNDRHTNWALLIQLLLGMFVGFTILLRTNGSQKALQVNLTQVGAAHLFQGERVE